MIAAQGFFTFIFIVLAVLNVNVDFVTMLIGVDTRRFLRENGEGEKRPDRPRKAKCLKLGNQQPSLTQS